MSEFSWARDVMNRAKVLQRDEFYTRREDIEAEMVFYERFFRGRSVFLPCDDFRVSEFFRFFVRNRERLGVRRVSASAWKQGPDLFGGGEPAPWAVVSASGAVNGWHRGDGDFRSDEVSDRFLDDDPIVVTNPPFSLFGEFFGWLKRRAGDFLVLGPANATCYVTVFPSFLDGSLRLGVNNRGSKFFRVPDSYLDVWSGSSQRQTADGSWELGQGNVFWFTNLDHGVRKVLPAFVPFDPGGLHKRYDNFDAFNVDRLQDFPEATGEWLGVPITFFDFYDPQFWELSAAAMDMGWSFSIGRRDVFKRLVVRRRLGVGGLVDVS